MSRYIKLGEWLGNSHAGEIEMSFKDIEEMLTFPLPDSAYTHRAWWSNDPNHSQAKEWLGYGWYVKSVSLQNKTVTFVKDEEKVRDIIEGKTRSDSEAKKFKEKARRRIASHLGVWGLFPGRYGAVPKLFYMVSKERSIVGTGKYFKNTYSGRVAPSKLSAISEEVWLLQSSDADICFMVFGGAIDVPTKWLRKYGRICTDVDFYYYDHHGNKLLKWDDWLNDWKEVW